VKVDIHLTKRNRRTLLKLCRRVFVNYEKIIISKRTITLKRKWYSLDKTRMQVVDLVLLHLPHAINNLYKEYELGSPFDYGDSLGAAVEYFGVKSVGGDLIQFLQSHVDTLDMTVALNEGYSADPILLETLEEPCVIESHATKKAFSDSIVHFYNLMTDVITKIQPKLEVVYTNTESSCNSPPIRAPGEQHVTLLSA